nr:MAG TPA: hypothetical protein [Caudoviricetes sp.]
MTNYYTEEIPYIYPEDIENFIKEKERFGYTIVSVSKSDYTASCVFKENGSKVVPPSAKKIEEFDIPVGRDINLPYMIHKRNGNFRNARVVIEKLNSDKKSYNVYCSFNIRHDFNYSFNKNKLKIKYNHKTGKMSVEGDKKIKYLTIGGETR